MIVELTNKIGTRLPTAGCIFKEDLTIIPKLPSGGGGAELNIAYGDTPPEDTTKLWCKCSEPSGVIVSKDIETAEGSGGVRTLSAVMPEPTISATSAVKGTKIYLFGSKIKHDEHTQTIKCFDTETETIITLSTKTPEMGAPATAQTVGDKIYLFGGHTGSKKSTAISCFDTETETIITLSTKLDSGCTQRMASVRKDNKIYLMGGDLTGTAVQNVGIWCFDTDNETIEMLTTQMPYRISCVTYTTVGNKLYMAYTASDGASFTQILCFDAEKETVYVLTNTLPVVLYNAGVSSIGNKIYFFGGSDKSFNYVQSDMVTYNTIYCLDVETETITELTETLPESQFPSAVETVGNKIYIFGGRTSGTLLYNNYYYNITTEIYSFAEGAMSLQNGVLQIVPTEKKNIFRILNAQKTQMEIGVQEVFKGNENNEALRMEASLYKDGAWTNI